MNKKVQKKTPKYFLTGKTLGATHLFQQRPNYRLSMLFLHQNSINELFLKPTKTLALQNSRLPPSAPSSFSSFLTCSSKAAL